MANIESANREFQKFIEISRQFLDQIENELPDKLSHQRIRILNILYFEGEMKVSDLSNKFKVSQPGINRMLSQMEGLYLIERQYDSNNRGETFYSLTEHGEKIIVKELNDIGNVIKKQFEKLNTNELDDLECCLNKMSHIFEKIIT